MHIQRIKKIFENLDLKIVYMKFLVSISDLLKKKHIWAKWRKNGIKLARSMYDKRRDPIKTKKDIKSPKRETKK